MIITATLMRQGQQQYKKNCHYYPESKAIVWHWIYGFNKVKFFIKKETSKLEFF